MTQPIEHFSKMFSSFQTSSHFLHLSSCFSSVRSPRDSRSSRQSRQRRPQLQHRLHAGEAQPGLPGSHVPSGDGQAVGRIQSAVRGGTGEGTQPGPRYGNTYTQLTTCCYSGMKGFSGTATTCLPYHFPQWRQLPKLPKTLR